MATVPLLEEVFVKATKDHGSSFPCRWESRKRSVVSSCVQNQRGAILLMALFSVTLIGLMAGIAGSSWQTLMQRNKETELLWKGNQIRQAIKSYYEFSASNGIALKQYPSTLDDLLQDPRSLEITRHLRQLYPDPLIGAEWELIPAPGGGIMGVKSSIDEVPFKQDGFAEENKSFVEKQSYQQWQFIYRPVQGSNTTAPAAASAFGAKIKQK